MKQRKKKALNLHPEYIRSSILDKQIPYPQKKRPNLLIGKGKLGGEEWLARRRESIRGFCTQNNSWANLSR